ncbi:MAG: hypothetical protein HOO89_12120 [Ferruginibacter sp.]|nr:hypothetical protein [Ferruginibacter sp.]
MKKLLIQIFVALLFVNATMAQAPGIFNYQAVARNAVGNALSNKNIAIKISVHDGTATGAIVYSETRTATTNPFGLFNVQIGSPGATNVIGTVTGVNWATGTKFLEVEMDPAGGSAFVAMGTTQLASVPFALNAAGAAPIGPAGGDLAGTYPNPLIKLPLIKAQSDAGSLVGITNSGAGSAIEGISTGTGKGGYFAVNNPASTADGLRGETNGTGASWGVRGISTGTNGAGLFQQTNTTNTSNNLQSNQAGLGRAGLFNATNSASTANAVDINVAGTGFALRAASSNATPKALLTVGGLQLTGIGEAANRILVSDAVGNATW